MELADWSNPIRKVKPPKVREIILGPVKLGVIQSMIDTCDKSFHGLRDRALFLTLLDTGIRARELIEINLEDFEYPGSRSGRANIAGGGRRKVLGILYEVEKPALEMLDEVEDGYKRIYVPVISESGARILAHTHISDSAGENQPPTPEHLHDLQDGAIEHSLPDWYLSNLKRIETLY